MLIEDVSIILVYITISSITIIVLIYLGKLRSLNKQIKESSTIIGGIVSELRNRLNDQDSKIVDQEVKIEILELKVAKLLKESLLFSTSKATKRIGQEEYRLKPRRDITFQGDVEPHRELEVNDLTRTEQDVIRVISNKSYTARELQAVIGKTREHTARLLKKLFEEGYIQRDETVRPFVYRLMQGTNFTSE
jgi:CRP-like cAMP-binding protein